MSAWERSERKTSFAWSVLLLIDHLLGTAVIFVTFFTVAWLVWCGLSWLNSLYPFPDETFRFVTRMDGVLRYADAVGSGIVFCAGMWRFGKDVMS